MTIDLAAILKWCWEAILGVLHTAGGAAVVLGLLIGIALAEALAQLLPPAMDAYTAVRITRLSCFGASLTTTFTLDATLTGFYLAVLAGLAGPTVHGAALRIVAARWPAFAPKALIPGPGDNPPPPSILRRKAQREP